MTALYGFVSPARQRAFLLSDDALLGQPTRVNKVSLIGDFAVGVHGDQTMSYVVENLALHCHQTGTAPPDEPRLR
jgi:hypothetical protein